MTEPAPVETSPPTWRRKWPYHRVIIISLFVVVTIALLIVFIIPWGRTSRAKVNVGVCRSHLNNLSLAMKKHAEDHGQRFPERIEQLLYTGELGPNDFVCPNNENDNPAPPGPTTRQTIQNIESSGKHLSYVYVGKGMTYPPPANVVLIYEPLGHHPRDSGVVPGAHLLFGDGHIKYIPEPEMEPIIKELKAGKNPPPSASGY